MTGSQRNTKEPRTRTSKRRSPSRRLMLGLVAATLAVTATACSNDSTSDTTAAETPAASATTEVPAVPPTTLGTAGALVGSTANASIAIPAGALSDPAPQLTVTSQPPPAIAAGMLGEAVSAAGNAVEATLSTGTLVGGAQVTFSLPSDFDATAYVPGVVWADGAGGWELLESTWSPEAHTVTATTTHFSIGWPIKIDVSKIAHGITDWVTGLVTGRARAANPTCGDEQAVRAGGVSVTSDSGDLVKWCYGRDRGRDVVKVTNNWRAGTQVTFPKTWNVVSYEGAGFDLQSLGDWLDSVSSDTSTTRSRLVGSGQTIVLEPGAIPPGTTTSIVAEPSTVSYLWSIALTGIDLYLLTLGKLARIDGNTKAEDLLTGVAFIKCYTAHYGSDINATAPVEPGSTFDTISKATKFGLDCGKDVLQDLVKGRGGILGKVGAAVIGVLAAAIGVVYGLINGLFTGIRGIIDNVGELFDRTEIGGYGYDITLVGAAAPATTSASTATSGSADVICPNVPNFNAAGDDAVNVRSHAADCQYVDQLIHDLGAQRDWRNDDQSLDVIDGVSCIVIEESVADLHAPWWGCEGGGYSINFEIRAAQGAPSAGTQCSAVEHVDDNDNRADTIAATGMTCAETSELVRAVVAAEGGPNTSTTLNVSGFVCEIQRRANEASIIEDYSCTNGGRHVTWQVHYGE